MLLFGYIISDSGRVDLPADVIKVVRSEDECERSVPRLVIGLENAKKYAASHGMRFDILDRHFPNGDMWTFRKTEKREYYENDVEEFRQYIIRSITKGVEYYYINVYKLRYNDIKRLYDILLRNKLRRAVNYVLVDNDMLYYPLEGRKVMGISLACLRYVGIDREKVISRVREGRNNRMYYSTSKNMWRLKEWFGGREYVIPCILSNNLEP